jgi:hypothetical protein
MTRRTWHHLLVEWYLRSVRSSLCKYSEGHLASQLCGASSSGSNNDVAVCYSKHKAHLPVLRLACFPILLLPHPALGEMFF